MGIAFKDLIISKEINIDSLQNKVLTVDSHNMIYQFLTTIRGRDGKSLMDSKGNITSHLVGLFSRTTNFIQKNLKLVFVFDGKPPDLKKKTLDKRKEIKIEAEKKYQDALKKEDIEDMKKYGARTVRLTENIIVESKKLIQGLGLPVIQAPSEGEAQAAYIVKKGDAFSTLSQDYDSLIHNSTKLVRNLSIMGRRKMGNKLSYQKVNPEIIDLAENLNNLGIDQNQLIALSMLIGTDYNPGGIKGIGPKNALKLVKKNKGDFDNLFKEVKWNDFFEFSWEEVYYLIKKLPVKDDYDIKWDKVNVENLKKLLVDEHDFSEERVESTLNKLNGNFSGKKQKGLTEFF